MIEKTEVANETLTVFGSGESFELSNHIQLDRIDLAVLIGDQFVQALECESMDSPESCICTQQFFEFWIRVRDLAYENPQGFLVESRWSAWFTSHDVLYGFLDFLEAFETTTEQGW